ncbi:MAG TPA: methyltransferase domain-containing protein [Terracidiphilus sp.]|nr:methyltransferase domain-containing protein [Terracidiphilus sp.]
MLVFDHVTDWGVFRSTSPYRPGLGIRRGSCIDRFYIEAFLAAHKAVIRGRVAEMESNEYTLHYGAGAVTQSDVIDLNPQNQACTLALDLQQTSTAPESLFDCILCTQTLFLIRDYAAAIRTLHRMLKPGGTLLATVPGISPVIRGSLIAGAGEDYWRFTSRSAQIAFGQVFGDAQVTVQAYGNVLACTAFLQGIVQEELAAEELVHHDPDYELIIAIAATKPTST